MEKSKNSINVEGGFLFYGGWNFSKLVSVGPTFIREMRVAIVRHCINDFSQISMLHDFSIFVQFKRCFVTQNFFIN